MAEQELLTLKERDKIRKDWLGTVSLTFDSLIDETAKAQLSKSQKPEVCPECKGEKQVNTPTGQSTGEYWACPTCQGTGIQAWELVIKIVRDREPESKITDYTQEILSLCEELKGR